MIEPLPGAAWPKQKIIVEFLLNYDLRSDTFTSHVLEESLATASSQSHCEVVKMLLDSGRVDINAKFHGKTALFLAATRRHEPVVKKILGTR